MAITVANWYNNLGTTVQPAFNTAAMTTLTLPEIIFGAATAYRQSQVAYNNGTSVQLGNYVNFVSPLVEDALPALDNVGGISKSSKVTLQVKTVYSPGPKVQPQQSVTII